MVIFNSYVKLPEATAHVDQSTQIRSANGEAVCLHPLNDISHVPHEAP